MGFFGNLFGLDRSEEQAVSMLQQGAGVLDVRTVAEYQGGHVAGSKNIPLQELPRRVQELKGRKGGWVVCCRSGARSGQAVGLLEQAGITCINGGSWQQVNAAQGQAKAV